MSVRVWGRAIAGVAIVTLALGSATASHAADLAVDASQLAAAWPESAATARAMRPPVPKAALPAAPMRGLKAAARLDGVIGQPAVRSIRAGYAEALLGIPLSARLTAELTAGLLAIEPRAGLDPNASRTTGRLRLGDELRSAWLGASFEQGVRGERAANGPLLSLGAAARVGGVGLSAALEQTAEPVRVSREVRGMITDSLGRPVEAPATIVNETRLTTATHALLSGRWEYQRLSVETVGGFTLNPLAPARWWSLASASVAVRPRLAVFATVGRPAPRWFAQRAGLDHGGALGLRLSSQLNAAAESDDRPSALPCWRLRHLGQQCYVIEIRAPHAGQVSVMGSFTDWQPVALRHLTGERWALAFELAPGVYQVQAQVDGGLWLPPAGLAVTADGFSGAAGVFVAE